jgi:hypothetical protein
MDALLDGCDLCRRWLVTSENIETERRNFWKPIVLRALAMILSNSAVPLGPFAEIRPNSAICPRMAFDSIVRVG